jgi:hypothetical protein
VHHRTVDEAEGAAYLLTTDDRRQMMESDLKAKAVVYRPSSVVDGLRSTSLFRHHSQEKGNAGYLDRTAWAS